MSIESTEPKPGFFKEQILPLILIFLIPGFSLWFFDRAEDQFDDSVRQSIIADINRDIDLSTEEKDSWLQLFQSTSVSEIMASSDPDLADLQANFESLNFTYTNFRWAKRLALTCLASSLFAFVFVGIGVPCSTRSHSAIYRALRIGWPVLRLIAVVQVICQSILAVALSYWLTAIWFEVYFIKLIAIIAIIALGAVFLILKAIFSKPQERFEQTGELVTKTDAPDLWQRVNEIATRHHTAPPEQIIAGIDASFFVTEHDTYLDDHKLTGRTLFVSLPLLKLLTVQEADAVLAHEMAHFSGDDTLWSRRISPFLGEMSRYLQALYEGAISRPVFHFLHFFWKLYQSALGRMSRTREFRADGIGAETSSPQSLANALIKISAYCNYRNETESKLIEQRDLDPELNIVHQLDHGFPIFLSTFTSDPKAAFSEYPHPFDSHPPLSRRVEALGLTATEALQHPELHQPVRNSWRDAILTADSIEDRLWKKQEELIKDFHGINQAWSLRPDSPENLALITRHFPAIEFTGKKGLTATLDHAGLCVSNWENPIPFTAIQTLQLHDSIGSKLLAIKFTHPDTGKTKTIKLKPEDFTCPDGNLLVALGNYYARYQNACPETLESA